jgi:peptide deformylase
LLTIVTCPSVCVTLGDPVSTALSPRIVEALTFHGTEARGETVVINPEIESTQTDKVESRESTQRSVDEATIRSERKNTNRHRIRVRVILVYCGLQLKL